MRACTWRGANFCVLLLGYQVMCENQEGVESLLTGYSTAVGVGLRLDTYYPLGAAQCCTPALLLDNGDLWSFRRCNCQTFPNEINCPYDKGFASMGFAAWRMTRGGSVVPIAPAECCQVTKNLPHRHRTTTTTKAPCASPASSQLPLMFITMHPSCLPATYPLPSFLRSLLLICSSSSPL